MAKRLIPTPQSQLRYQRAWYRGKTTLAGTSRRWWWLLAAGALLLFAGNIVFGEGGVLQGNDLDTTLQATRQANSNRERELAHLRRAIAVSESDPTSYEKPARERFRMMREGERLYLFEDDMRIPPGPWDAAFADTSIVGK